MSTVNPAAGSDSAYAQYAFPSTGKSKNDGMGQADFLRLMTEQPLASNMSNTLRNVSGVNRAAASAPQTAPRWADWPPVQKVLLGIYDRIFRLYYDR